MNLLFVLRNCKISGINSYVQAILPALRDLGHRTVVLAAPGPIEQEIRRSCDRFYPRPLLPAWSVRAIARVAAREEIEVISAQTPRVGAHALQALPKPRVPVVVHCHSQLMRELPPEVIQSAAMAVAHNRVNADWLRSRFPELAERVHSAPLAVDTGFFASAPPAPGEPMVTYIARLGGNKGRYMLPLMQAGRELAGDYPGLRLEMVGLPRWRQPEARRAAAHHNQQLGRKLVTLHPILRDIRPFYERTHLLIGAGYVALEGLATGRWVIGLGVTGLFGLVTEETFAPAADANFGDAASAMGPEVSAAQLAGELRRALDLVAAGRSAQWAPPAVQKGFSVPVAAQHLEEILLQAAREA